MEWTGNRNRFRKAGSQVSTIGGMVFMLWLIIMAVVFGRQLKAFLAKAEAQKREAELKAMGPEFWLKVKEMEHEKARMKHEGNKAAQAVGGAIVRAVAARLLK